ncbi:hypothetical protein AM493_03755 [Flavobacterium akiainvivens]|uniref:NodB homology domain-containing protein n=1 Tax=Flavobacterium akiainvivens TaxID=1202724 RepID=A0A0M9VJV5_9FLAO|nr:hypothetical protein AM493_03755 [Flavobacterium akiainvivens]
MLISCSPDDPHAAGDPYEAGIVLTFDDDYADEWCDADEILGAYNWKATFFVTKYQQLSQEHKNKIYGLELNGHEIAGHGYNHVNSKQYVAGKSTERYAKDEIQPMIKAMGKDGFSLRSFSYPYGSRNGRIDTLLLDYFDIIRGTTYGRYAPQKQACYYNGSRLVFGLGIDQSYSHADIKYLKSLMQYAKDQNKIVIFYGHKPVEKPSGTHQASMKKLEEICKFANKLGLKYYTASELYGLE